MDPFNHLPWFVLQDILSYLPDLPTLHRLYDASPAVASFLNEDRHGVFPKVVEAVISHPSHDQGLYPSTQFLLRTIVLIWWRAYSRDAPDNPLPVSYNEIFNSFRRRGFRLPECYYGDASLPASTPAIVLNRLLSFSTRLRQMTHACFHGLVARCMALEPEHLEHPETRYTSETKVKPPGRPYTPIDIGPPSWIEEQRLMTGFLRIMLFFELRKEILSHGNLDTGNEVVCQLQSRQVEEFWDGLLNCRERSLVRTVMTWLVPEVGDAREINSWMDSPSLPSSLIYCCPELTPLTEQQRSMTEVAMVGNVPAIGCYRHCRMLPESPLRDIDFAVFRPYGFAIWGTKRMRALGLLPRSGDGERISQDHANIFFHMVKYIDKRAVGGAP